MVISKPVESKRAQYIDRPVDIRNTDPVQVLTAIDRYAGDHYGAMLYDLFDEKSTG